MAILEDRETELFLPSNTEEESEVDLQSFSVPKLGISPELIGLDIADVLLKQSESDVVVDSELGIKPEVPDIGKGVVSTPLARGSVIDVSELSGVTSLVGPGNERWAQLFSGQRIDLVGAPRLVGGAEAFHSTPCYRLSQVLDRIMLEAEQMTQQDRSVLSSAAGRNPNQFGSALIHNERVRDIYIKAGFTIIVAQGQEEVELLTRLYKGDGNVAPEGSVLITNDPSGSGHMEVILPNENGDLVPVTRNGRETGGNAPGIGPLLQEGTHSIYNRSDYAVLLIDTSGGAVFANRTGNAGGPHFGNSRNVFSRE